MEGGGEDPGRVWAASGTARLRSADRLLGHGEEKCSKLDLPPVRSELLGPKSLSKVDIFACAHVLEGESKGRKRRNLVER